MDTAKTHARVALTEAFAAGSLQEDVLDAAFEALEQTDDPRAVAALLQRLGLTAAPMPNTTALARATSRRFTAYVSSERQRRPWVPAAYNEVRAVFGGVELDLREATLAPGRTVFHLSCVLSELVVIVPPTVAVHVTCSRVAASVTVDATIPEHTHESGVSLEISGALYFSALEVREQHEGETRRTARKRHKAQRRRHGALTTGR